MAINTSLPYNSPLTDPARCPTHIEIAGYGRVPISIQTQGFFSSAFTPIVPNVPERILYCAPSRPGDVVHQPPQKLAPLLWSLMGACVGAGALVGGILLSSPVLAALGAVAWMVGILALVASVIPATRNGDEPVTV